MQRHFAPLILTAALSLLGTQTLSAQQPSASANIPFAFQVQNTSFAPGTYIVTRNAVNGLVSLRDVPGHSRIFTTYPEAISQAKDPKLTFTCYGDNCELSRISLPNSLDYGLPTSSRAEQSRKVGMAPSIRSIRLTTR